MTTLSGRVRWLGLGAGVALLGAVACGRSSDSNTELLRDLERAGSDRELELMPALNRTDVISAAERSPRGAAAPAASQRTPTPRAAPRAEIAPVPEPEVQETPAPAVTPAQTPPPTPTEGTARPRPTTRPPQEPPPGGWKTVDEVIRKAPFPINP